MGVGGLRGLTVLTVLTTANWAFSGVAAAQDSTAAAEQSATVDDIVVTAQKREQRLQDVPLSVSAFDAETIENSATLSLADLDGRVPNTILAPVGAYQYASSFAIRGIGFADVESTFEPTVATVVDGVYLARNVGALSDFFSIDSVEVLRGPQGTLYGRNTIGGVVNMRTRRPTGDFGLRMQTTFGNFDRRDFRGLVEAPILGDALAGQISLLLTDFDGFSHNEDGRRIGGETTQAGRATLAFTPTGNFDATLILDRTETDGTGPAFENASLPTMVLSLLGRPADADGDPWLVHIDAPIFQEFQSTGATLEANWNLGAATLTSVTGYRSTDELALTDFDASNLTFLNALRDQGHEQWSEELRIASNGEGPLDYVFGIYYLDQTYDIVNAQGGGLFGGATLQQIASQDATAYAAFGQLDWRAIERLTLTVGGRYSYEEKTFTNQPLGFPSSMIYSDEWEDFSPKFGASYAWTADLMTYAQWSRGFRSGGFNGRAATFTSAGPYDAEIVETTEAGFKSDWLDRRLRLNLAVFTSAYSDMQQSVQTLTSAGVHETITRNAAEARIDGLEVDATAILFDGLQLNATLGWLDARFEEFMADFTSDGVTNPTDNSDLPLTFAPEWTASVGATYEREFDAGVLIVQATASYADDMYTSFNLINRTTDLTVRDANTLIDATIAWSAPNGAWRFALWGKNLTDEVVVNNTFPVGPLMADRIYAPPRTWAFEIGLNF